MNAPINRRAALNLRWLSLLAILCLACSTILEAQQPSGAAGAASASAVGASSTTGLYSMGSSAPNRESAAELPTRMGSKAANQTGMTTSRSAWMAGAKSTGRASAGMWTPGDASFLGRRASSWIAGAGNFSLDRQQGGIWRLTPGLQVQPSTPIESNDLSTPSGLTSKGAEILQGARLSYSYGAHPHETSGIRGSIAGRAGTSFGAHAPSSGGFGRGAGVNSIEHTPSSTTMPGPRLHDTPDSDGRLRLHDSLGSGTAGALGESSH